MKHSTNCKLDIPEVVMETFLKLQMEHSKIYERNIP